MADAAALSFSITVVWRLFDPFAAAILIGKLPLAELPVVMTNDAKPEPVTIADAGDIVVFGGNPEGVTVTWPLNPCDPVTRTFMLATELGVLFTVEGFAEIVKSAGL